MKTGIIIFILFIIITGPCRGIDYRRNPAEVEAEKYIRYLGNQEYLEAYVRLAEHSKQKMLQLAIDKYNELDFAHYQRSEMDYLMRTNVQGHRTIMFEDYVEKYCKDNGIRKEDLKRAEAELVKIEQHDRVAVNILVSGKKVPLIMKMEAGLWKAAWYPY